MRNTFHDDLDAITNTLVVMAQLVHTATKDATTALLTADLDLAEKVIKQERTDAGIYATSFISGF